MKAIIPIMGFRQDRFEAVGFERLYFRVIRKYGGENCITYFPEPWTVNTKLMAQQLIRYGVREVCLITYSHGQSAAVDLVETCHKLTQQAGKPHIRFTLWLTCDSVGRRKWIPRLRVAQPLAARSLTKGMQIKVPGSVRRVVGVRQKVDTPAGHDFVAQDAGTQIEPLEFLPYTHKGIDECEEWFHLVDEELKTWSAPRS